MQTPNEKLPVINLLYSSSFQFLYKIGIFVCGIKMTCRYEIIDRGGRILIA